MVKTQRLLCAIIWQNMTWFVQYVWFSKGLRKSAKVSLQNMFIILDERSRNARKCESEQNFAFLTYIDWKEHPVDFFWLFYEKLILKTKLHCNPWIYLGVKNIFSHSLAFFQTKIEKLVFHFVFMKVLKSKNEMLAFKFWVPKIPTKNRMKIVFNSR